MGRYKRIYMLAPYKCTTGGIELCHQLVDHLRNCGEQAFIVYIIGKNISNDLSVTAEYSKYDICVTNTIEDSEDNMLILPEIYYDFAFIFKRIQIGCWWMSVDNRYINCYISDVLRFRKSLLHKCKAIYDYYQARPHKYHNINTNRRLKQQGDRITHFYQSCYAQQHLYRLGLSKVLPLTDYVNTYYAAAGETPTTEKKDIILYNPSKGLLFTQKIIAKMPGYEFIPLKGLTREQLKQLFSDAKLYIDFGHFPGKDRLHREAALNRCCIITGKNGAARFYEDVPIGSDYKFEATKSSLPAIVERIKYVLAHYDSCIHDFEFLRKTIMGEQAAFYREVETAFL